MPDTPQELNNAVPNLPESFKIAKVECLLYILHEILMSIPKDEHDDIMIRMTALNEMLLNSNLSTPICILNINFKQEVNIFCKVL